MSWLTPAPLSLFRSDSTLSGREYDPAAGARLTKEAVTLRGQRREQQRRPRPLATLGLSRQPAAASWQEVGRSLLHLYRHVADGGAALVSGQGSGPSGRMALSVDYMSCATT